MNIYIYMHIDICIYIHIILMHICCLIMTRKGHLHHEYIYDLKSNIQFV